MTGSKWLVCLVGASALAGCLGDDADPVRADAPFHFDVTAVPPMTASGDPTAWLRAVPLAPGETLVEPRVMRFPHLGTAVAVAVASSAQSSRLVAVDADGAPVEVAALEAAEARLRHARRGKLSERAYANMAAGKDQRVLVLLDVPLAPLRIEDLDPQDPDLGAQVKKVRAARSAVIARTAAPVADWLRGAGAVDVVVRRGLPVIEAHVSPDLLRQRFLHEHAAVVEVDDAAIDERERLTVYEGYGAMGNAALTGGACGGPCVGKDTIGAAVWEGADESSTLAVYNDRFWFDDVFGSIHPPKSCTSTSQCAGLDQDYTCRNATGALGNATTPGRCVAQHATWVAGMIGVYGEFTEDGTLFPRAGAYKTQLFHANDGDSIGGMDFIVDSGLLYANRSMSVGWSGPTSTQGRAMDWAVRNEHVFVTHSAGNDGDDPADPSDFEDKVDCRNYNWMCVGSYDVGVWNNRSDDRRSDFSDWRNVSSVNPDTTTKGERPHVLTPGNGRRAVDMCSADAGMTDIGCPPSGPATGTSFSAPAALGVALLAHNYDGVFTNTLYPIMKKAVLMVSAKDANGDGPTYWQAGVDGKDGAGAPDFARIKAIYDNDTAQMVHVQPSDFPTIKLDGTSAEVVVADVFVPAGSMIRVAAAWNSCAVQGLYGTNTLADFDVYLSRPVGSHGTTLGTCTYICSPPAGTCPGGSVKSDSSFNEVELIDDRCLKTASQGGTYRIRLRRKANTTFNLCGQETTEPIAVVWDVMPAP